MTAYVSAGGVGFPVVNGQMSDESLLGPNAWLVDEMREQWLENPQSVTESWQAYFAAGLGPATPKGPIATLNPMFHSTSNGVNGTHADNGTHTENGAAAYVAAANGAAANGIVVEAAPAPVDSAPAAPAPVATEPTPAAPAAPVAEAAPQQPRPRPPLQPRRPWRRLPQRPRPPTKRSLSRCEVSPRGSSPT